MSPDNACSFPSPLLPPASPALTWMPLYRSRLTRHDAPASIRGAYTPAEMQAMLAQTTAAQVDLSTHYLYRMGIIAWRNGGAA